MRGALIALTASCLAACMADPGWARRVGSIEATLAAAESAGAMRCAPRELALGRAHLAFAVLERERGHRSRADEHLAVRCRGIPEVFAARLEGIGGRGFWQRPRRQGSEGRGICLPGRGDLVETQHERALPLGERGPRLDPRLGRSVPFDLVAATRVDQSHRAA